MEKRLLNNCHLLSTSHLYSVLISLTQIIQVDAIYCRYHVQNYVNVFNAAKCVRGVTNYTILNRHIRSLHTSVISIFVPIYLGPCGLGILSVHVFIIAPWYVCILGQLSYLYLCTRTPAYCCKNRLAINRRMCTHYKKEWDVFVIPPCICTPHYIIRTHYIILISL